MCQLKFKGNGLRTRGKGTEKKNTIDKMRFTAHCN